MSQPKGLGRGLASIIGQDPGAREPKKSSVASEGKSVSSMAIDILQRNPYNPRGEIQEANLEGLADSIKKNGVIQPIIIREKLGKYEIIAGERRWLAAKMVGLREIPVRLIEVSDEEAMQFALVENLQREDLTPLQIANGLNDLIKKHSLTHEQVAEALGWSRVAVTNKLRLLNLPEEMQQFLNAGDISEGHARAMLGLPDVATMMEVCEELLNKDWSVRQLEEKIRQINEAKASQADVSQGNENNGSEEGKGLREYRLTGAPHVWVRISGRGRKRTLVIRNIDEPTAEKILSLLEEQSDSIFPGK